MSKKCNSIFDDLTKAQLTILADALTREHYRVHTYGVHNKTIAVLLEKGFIHYTYVYIYEQRLQMQSDFSVHAAAISQMFNANLESGTVATPTSIERVSSEVKLLQELCDKLLEKELVVNLRIVDDLKSYLAR